MHTKPTPDSQISLFFKSYTIKACSIFILVSFLVGAPSQANAGFFDFLTGATDAKTANADDNNTDNTNDFGTDDSSLGNSQNLHLLESSMNPDVKNVNDCTNVDMDDGALVPSTCDMGIGLENSSNGEMRVYEVQAGDTLSEVAMQFDVSMNTIKWENNLSSNTLKVGQKLNILPTTGVKHIVKKGDTIEKIAAKYDADAEDIKVFNGLSGNSSLKQGDILYVPNGVIKAVVVVEKPSSIKRPIVDNSTPVVSGYYMKPTVGPITSPYGSRRRAFHYGVDIGAARGTPVAAAADGVVIETLDSCREGRSSCGGRYGNYIVIAHNNGTTTRYAHLSRVMIGVGEQVAQGQRIGSTGNTGHSTGPHLHFQIEKSNGKTIRPVF
ncbi:M23 family metallopeptidase [Candidatus Nomurabacteria bacterium]|nr:M23 family metallopeptidase [Candidatus Nomurabacteria bacterium]